MMTEFLLDLASCIAGSMALGMHSAGLPADERATTDKDWTQHTFTALRSLWNGKMMT